MERKINSMAARALLLVLVVLMISRCTPIDYHYRDYLENAEKVYPGRVDSLLFLPGNKRAAVRALMSTDARVGKMSISWGIDGYYETEVTDEDIATYKQVVIPEIEEGIYTFDIRTYDGEGNSSMRAEIFGRVYGESYVENLNHRIIDNVRQTEGGLLINWFPESADSTLLGTLVRYMTNKGDSAHVTTGAVSNQTMLPDYRPETEFAFTTRYKPTALAIDTFYAAFQTVDPAEFIVTERTLYPKETWSIAGFSSENTADRHAVANLIDGTSETFWIARFASPATNYPDHWVTVDMGEVLNVDGFYFAQKNGDRKIREMEILVGDDNETWESLGLVGLRNIDREYQYIDLEAQKSFRYFKLIPVSGHDSQRQPGLAEAGTFFY
ncbi:DUF4998 domain-containing protein [Parapedobacter deserti]|uniref:DUF4998 domain-containing protein n=1 Tax=Parapedobacter deserti TaxID=1912957 RepID=A0ABV7JGR7_9SPHI